MKKIWGRTTVRGHTNWWKTLPLWNRRKWLSIAVQWQKIPFSSTFSWPRNPLSNHLVCFITHNFVNWNNFRAVLVWVVKSMWYHSRKTSPEGKGGFAVEVHVLLTLSPYIPPREAGDVWYLPPSGISGLSFDSTLLSPLLFFCLVLLSFLSYLFLPAGRFF